MWRFFRLRNEFVTFMPYPDDPPLLAPTAGAVKPTRLLVSMGLRRSGRVSDPLRPQLVEVDADAGTVLRVLDIEPSDEALASPTEPAECTVASWDGDLLLQPLLTELVWIDIVRWEVARRLSHPWMHGIHSAVRLPSGLLAISVAGADSVLELDDQGVLQKETRLGPGPWPFGSEVDLRRLPYGTLKPHRIHPNHVCFVDGCQWTTCFQTSEAVCTDGRRIGFGEAQPHDGRLIDGLLWFTLTDGRVIAVDPVSLRRVDEIDVNKVVATRRRLGWCRGIEVLGPRLWVGLTTLRKTTRAEVLRWMMQGERGRKLPTRILEVDRTHRQVVREIHLGNAAGGTIYGILHNRMP